MNLLQRYRRLLDSHVIGPLYCEFETLTQSDLLAIYEEHAAAACDATVNDWILHYLISRTAWAILDVKFHAAPALLVEQSSFPA